MDNITDIFYQNIWRNNEISILQNFGEEDKEVMESYGFETQYHHNFTQDKDTEREMIYESKVKLILYIIPEIKDKVIENCST